ncbi:MAG: lipid-A-disaccharide synthase [Bacteroidales bacterium]|nr:lipid-A-disaccharide synthase [Bacteroidales bacterium]
MKLFMIAGEASGDLHASNLIREIRSRESRAAFSYIGGDLMENAAGGGPLVHYAEMNYMGFFDVLKNIFRIRRILKRVKTILITERPDAVILVDYAGFNLKLAKFASNHGLKVFYYISPKVWAWRESRVEKLKRYVDSLFVIFPFEVEYFLQRGIEVEYHGNPVTDAIEAFRHVKLNKGDFQKKYGLDERPVIALLAGSRRQEIKSCLPEMIAAAKSFPRNQFVVAGAPSVDPGLYETLLAGSGIPVIPNDTYNLLSNAEAAIVTSGTATLETALLKVPQVVVYKTGKITYRLGKLFVRTKFFSLVNLILDQSLVREVLQFNLKEEMIEELDRILNIPGYRDRITGGYEEIIERIGPPGSSGRIADRMLKLLQ